MRIRSIKPVSAVLALLLAGAAASGQQPQPSGPVQGEAFATTYIRLGSNDAEGLLYEPRTISATARLGLVYSHPSGNTFTEALGREMSRRGYRVMMVNFRGQGDMEAYLPAISRGIAYMRGLKGVDRVVLVGHSGGGPLTTLYENVAEHGPAACQGAGKIYPCSGKGLDGLQKPDGLVLLDPTLGAFHQMSAVDPAVTDKGRDPSLDMFAAANGFDAANKRARYTPDFARRFYAGQAARNARLVDGALARLDAIKQGKGQFSDDEPLVLRGVGVLASGARLYQPDTAFAAHTKRPELLLRADGSDVTTVVQSVRPPSGAQSASQLDALSVMNTNTTVRDFLAGAAIRTGADYAITADDIVGVEWKSAYTATPGNAEGVSVPALVVTMGCHYLVVPGEVVFDRLASRDKSYASVEGATHLFGPCRPEYGDTVKRTFDHVASWLAKPGRF